jgi:hypothetical protein
VVAGESGEVGNPGTLGMTKERATVYGKWLLGSAFFITLGGPQAHDNSGRDDNSVEDRIPRFQEKYEILAPTE